MEVSPEARRFNDPHPIEETEEMRKKFMQLCEEGKIVDAPIEPATVFGNRVVLQSLQDDLRKAGYRKLA